MTATATTMPAHDLAGIDLMLTQDERDVRQAVRAFVAAEMQPHVATWFEDGRIDDIRGLSKKLGNLGVLGMHLDGYGCAGMSATPRILPTRPGRCARSRRRTRWTGSPRPSRPASASP